MIDPLLSEIKPDHFQAINRYSLGSVEEMPLDSVTHGVTSYPGIKNEF